MTASDSEPGERPATARNPILVCVFHGLQMTLFPMAIISVFWKDQIGLDMTGIMLLQAAFALIVTICEFPSGIAADRLGYRRTLVIASGLAIVGWWIYYVAGSIATVLVGEVFLGISLSLISGADSALLYESLLEADREEEFATWYGRTRFFGQVAEGSAALFAGLLYALAPRFPIAIELGVWALAGAVALAMVEPRRHRPTEEHPLRQMRNVVEGVTRGPSGLRAVMVLSIALGLSSFVPVWIIQIYATDADVPVAWLGPIWAAANYIVALGAIASPALARRFGLMPTLALCIGLMSTAYLGLGLTHAWWGFAFYFGLVAMRGINSPILHHEEQRLVPSSDRAGFISFRSLLFRGSFVIVGPIAGLSIDRWGAHPVLLVLGAALTGPAVVAWIWMRRTVGVGASPSAQK